MRATVIIIIVRVLSSILSVFELLLFARAICSWIPSTRNTRVYDFLYRATEPFLRPIRDVMMRWEFARRCPIDLSFLLLVILVSVAQSLVPFLLYKLI